MTIIFSLHYAKSDRSVTTIVSLIQRKVRKLMFKTRSRTM